MANWGIFAGAASKAFTEDQDRWRKHEWEKYQQDQIKAENERKDQERRAAAATLGRAGTEIGDEKGTGVGMGMGAMNPDEYAQTPVTRTYSEDEAYADYGRRMAQAGNAAGAMGAKQARLGMKKLEREDRKGETEEKDDNDERGVLDIRRRVAAGQLSPMDGVKELAKLNSKHANGFTVGITDIQGKPHLAVTNEAVGQSQVVPWDDRAFDAATDRFLMYLNPKKYGEGRARQLEERKVGAQEDTARAAGVTASATMQRANNDTAMLPYQQRESRARTGLYGAQADVARLPVSRENNAQTVLPELNAATVELDDALRSGDQAKIAAARTRFNAAQTRYSTALGKPMQLSERGAGGASGGKGSNPYELKPTADGKGHVAHAKDSGRVVGWVTNTGRELPSGVSEEQFGQYDRQARAAGVTAGVVHDKNGKWVLGYISADGSAYTTPQEAAAANANAEKATRKKKGLDPELVNQIPR